MGKNVHLKVRGARKIGCRLTGNEALRRMSEFRKANEKATCKEKGRGPGWLSKCLCALNDVI